MKTSKHLATLALMLGVILQSNLQAKTSFSDHNSLPSMSHKKGRVTSQLGIDLWAMPMTVEDITAVNSSNQNGVVVYNRAVPGQVRFNWLFTGGDPNNSIHLEYGVGGGQINMKNKNVYLASGRSKFGFFNFYLGARFLPPKPTVDLGKMELRFTVAGLLGLQYLNGGGGFDPDLNAGFLFAGSEKRTGLLLGVDYHPLEADFIFDVNTGVISWEKYQVTIGTAPAFKMALVFGI